MGIYIEGMEMPKEGKRLSIDICPNGKVYTNLDLDCKQIATAVPFSLQDNISRDAAKRTMSMFIGYAGIDEDMVRRFEIALDNLPSTITYEQWSNNYEIPKVHSIEWLKHFVNP